MTVPTPRKLFLFVPALVTGLAAGAAHAQTDGAVQAVTILARARVIDERCHFLSPSLREELIGYAARAEIAAAEQITAARTRAAVKAGEADGRAASCNDAAKTDVRDTLAAARDAIKAADRNAAQSDGAGSADQTASMAGGMVGGLGYYAGQVKAYYLERKCKHLSVDQDTRYWQAIGRIHAATVARNGAAAVRPVMRRAEDQASALSCGSGSLAMVRTGYREATRH
jgi:hypothetical protein